MNLLMRLVAAITLSIAFQANAIGDEVWKFQFTPTGSRPYSGYCYGDCAFDSNTRADVAGTFSILLNRQTGAGKLLTVDGTLFNAIQEIPTPTGNVFQPVEGVRYSKVQVWPNQSAGHFHFQQNGLWRLLPDGLDPGLPAPTFNFNPYDIWFTLTTATFTARVADYPYANARIQDAFASLISVTTAGDFNGDARVDGADYVSWRKSGGSTLDYNLWRTYYGSASGSGLASDLVPEPSAILLVASGLFAVTSVRRRYHYGMAE